MIKHKTNWLRYLGTIIILCLVPFSTNCLGLTASCILNGHGDLENENTDSDNLHSKPALAEYFCWEKASNLRYSCREQIQDSCFTLYIGSPSCGKTLTRIQQINWQNILLAGKAGQSSAFKEPFLS